VGVEFLGRRLEKNRYREPGGGMLLNGPALRQNAGIMRVVSLRFRYLRRNSYYTLSSLLSRIESNQQYICCDYRGINTTNTCFDRRPELG
jgi:hypothetical protein